MSPINKERDSERASERVQADHAGKEVIRTGEDTDKSSRKIHPIPKTITDSTVLRSIGRQNERKKREKNKKNSNL